MGYERKCYDPARTGLGILRARVKSVPAAPGGLRRFFRKRRVRNEEAGGWKPNSCSFDRFESAFGFSATVADLLNIVKENR